MYLRSRVLLLKQSLHCHCHVELAVVIADKKESLDRKFEKLEQYLQCEDKCIPHYHQYIVNWICSTLDFVSTERFITENRVTIRRLLLLLSKSLRRNKDLKQRVSLKQNIYKVFLRLFPNHELVGSDNLMICFQEIVDDDLSREDVYMSPVLVGEMSSKLLEVMICSEMLLGNTVAVNVLCQLLELFNKLVKRKRNSMKRKLLYSQGMILNSLKLLRDGSKLPETHWQRLHELLKKTISIFICQKSVLLSLKSELLENNNAAPKKKKAKLSVQDISVLEILAKNSDVILTSMPLIYEIIVTGTREVKEPLTSHEAFCLLKKIEETYKLCQNDDVGITVNIYKKLMEIIVKFDIYKQIEDRKNDEEFFEWMKNVANHVIIEYEKRLSSELLKDILYTLELLLATNHAILLPYMRQILKICLTRADEVPWEDGDSKEKLLLNILDIFEKLYQLDKFMNYFDFDIGNNDVLNIPMVFLNRISAAFSMLEVKQLKNLLHSFIGHVDTIVKKGNMSYQLYFFYTWGYLLLMNMSPVPTYGYLTEELESLLMEIKLLKEKMENMLIHLSDPRGIDSLYALVQHGINNVYLLLQEFELLKDEDSSLVEFGPKSNRESVVDDYLHVCLLTDEIHLKRNFDALDTYNWSEKSCKDLLHSWNGQAVFSSQVIQEMYFLFHALTLDGVTKFKILKYDFKYIAHFLSTSVTFQLLYQTQQFGLVRKPLIWCISKENCKRAIYELLRQNQSVLLESKKREFICHYAQLMWKDMLSGSNEESKKYLPEAISCPDFQTALIQVLTNESKKFLSENAHSELMQIIIHNYQEFDTEKLKSLYIHKGRVALVKLDKEDAQELLKEFQVISKLPLRCFRPVNLNLLGAVVFDVVNGIDLTHQRLIQKLAFELLVHLITNICFLRSTCYIPIGKTFKLGYDCFASLSMEDFSSSCAAFKVLAKSSLVLTSKSSKQDPNLQEVVKSSSIGVLKRLHFECIVWKEVLQGFYELLTESHSVKQHGELMLYEVGGIIAQRVLALVQDQQTDIVINEILPIYLLLCRILQAGSSKGKGDNERVTKIVVNDIFPLLSTYLKDAISSENIENQVMEFIIFLYENSGGLSIKLRATIIDESIRTRLMKTCFKSICNCSEKESAHKSILVNILQAEEILEQLKSLLGMLFDWTISEKKFNQQLKDLWTHFLKYKWSKEQKVVLYEVVPKIIITAINCLRYEQNAEDLLSTLDLLIAVAVITKGSKVSHCITLMYHATAYLSKRVENVSGESAFTLYEAIYQLWSQVLFNHQLVVFSSLPAFVDAVNCLLNYLIYFVKKAIVPPNKLERCCEILARLYRELSSYKSAIAKYSPYLVSTCISKCQSIQMNMRNKKVIDGGIYCLLDACGEHELASLKFTMSRVNREYFKEILWYYEKHHKFHG